jgi:hypothetical protein
MRQQLTPLRALRQEALAALAMLITVTVGTVLVMLLIGGGH